MTIHMYFETAPEVARYVYIQTADRTVHFAHRTERGSSLSKTVAFLNLIPYCHGD